MAECTFCGHEWIETRAADVEADQAVAETSPDIRHLINAARQAREAFVAERRKRHTKGALWLAFLMFAVGPIGIALVFPEPVVAAAPAAIALYDWLNRDVNIYGVGIRKLKVEHIQANGQPMIAVKGELTNISGSPRKMPWLRFGLRDDALSEVYSWQLDTGARILKPGESRSFVTRLASPPETARKLEIRFARADEIGSNTAP